jgi:hypothetical protein
MLKMRVLKTVVGVTALACALALPAMASADAILPPGNSAATQYTETFPTSSGNAVVNGALGGGGQNGGGGKTRPPKQVLGAETTETLESHGEEGRTIAALAAEAAPPSADSGQAPAHQGNGHANGGAKSNGSGEDSSGGGNQSSTGPTAPSGPGLSETASSGDSAFGQVLSQATASSSGTMGFFLPLAIVLALIWAIAYVWRRHQPSQAAS